MVLDQLRVIKRHVVYPSTPAREKSAVVNTVPARTYGSWCTPEGSPAHIGTPDNTICRVESENLNFKHEDDKQENKKKSTILQLRGRLSSTRLLSKHDTSSDVADIVAELKELKLPISRCNSKQLDTRKISNETNSPANELPINTPSLPPPPETKRKKYFQLPQFADPFVTIDPHGRGYISWLFLVTFCYSYNAWCIVLRATFPYQTPENTPLWMTADYLCDLVYFLDVAYVKPRLMYLNEGFWVKDALETRKNYRRKLQYKFDVISLIPLDVLYLYFGTQMVILRFPRMLKLQTFWEFHQAMDRVLSSPYVVRIGKTLIYIFYLIHLNACAYYAMSSYIGLGTNGWVYDDAGNAYIRCFYFATKTATSIGKNPKPEQTVEYLFMTAAWLMGVFVFALLIGQIRDIYTTATRARTEYRKTVDGCIRYLRRLNMPTSLQRRVTSWFNYTWAQNRCFNETSILNSLPFNMKRDVLLEVHISTLSKVQLFRDCSDSLLRDLVLQLRPVGCLPGDVVVRRGDAGHHMYFIKAGECCVMSQDETEVVATLKEGSVFGEICLLGIDGLRRRTATVRSRGFSNLFALSRHDLEAALKHHKEAAKVLRLRADQIIKENAARQAKQRRQERLARKSASIQEECLSAGARRLSSVSSNESTKDARKKSASALSRRRLSAVSENKMQAPPVPNRPSLASFCSGVRTPLPTIVLPSD